MDDDQVSFAGELDSALEEPRLDHRSRGIVRVVEEEHIRALRDLPGDGVEVGQEPVRLLERQVVHPGTGEKRARRVGRVARVRRETDVTGVEQREANVADRLLAPERRDDLRVRIELVAKPPPIEAGRGLPELPRAPVARILVRRRIARRFS